MAEVAIGRKNVLESGTNELDQLGLDVNVETSFHHHLLQVNLNLNHNGIKALTLKLTFLKPFCETE